MTIEQIIQGTIERAMQQVTRSIVDAQSKNALQGKEYLTLRECAIYLGEQETYVSTLRNHVRSGALRAIKTGRNHLIKREDLVAYLDGLKETS